jgi:hypothetical protein
MADKKDDELMELGKKLQAFYDSGYVDKKQAIIFSFFKGLASGLGAFLGGTIVIGLVIWILSLFSQIPLIGHFMHILDQTLKTR